MTQAENQMAQDGGCSAGEAYALRVLGNDMAPEFSEGDIVVVEPDGAVRDGSFVVARVDDGFLLRQLRREGADWVLCALNADGPLNARVSLGPRLDAIHGVVIQKAVPGRRRLTRFYT